MSLIISLFVLFVNDIRYNSLLTNSLATTYISYKELSNHKLIELEHKKFKYLRIFRKVQQLRGII